MRIGPSRINTAASTMLQRRLELLAAQQSAVFDTAAHEHPVALEPPLPRAVGYGIRVPSPKTEHHEGGASRVIPLFPELRPLLLEAFEEAGEGEEYVVTACRSSTSNLRTQMHRIIHRAGLEPWPKTFQNLRSTRETELAEQYPIHVVCKWIGNSAAIAATHYLQLTDEHFARATGEKSTSEAAQNPTQKLQESARNGQNDLQGQDDENPSNAGDFKKKRLNAGDCERRLMTPTVSELPQKNRRKAEVVRAGDAESDACTVIDLSNDREVNETLVRIDSLPPAIQRAILVLIDSCRDSA